jgi:hypothetical protein
MRLTSLRALTFSNLLLALLWMGFPPFSARAQDGVVLQNVQVDIWPEYDQPSVLIIYHISLSSQTSLPASLSLRIPSAAGKPHAVAMQDPAGLYNLNYEMTAAGEWIELLFTTPVPDVRIEYYDPQLDFSDQERSYVYRWPGDYRVENLSLQIQQPPTATNMAFKPALGSGRPGDDGLTYFNYMVGPVDAGTSFDLSVSYTKSDDQLTNPAQFAPIQPQEPVSASTDGRVTLDQVLPWALGALSLLLIMAGVLWYWRTGRTTAPARERARHARRAVPQEEDAREAVFCHQCGKKAGSGDTFCRACGTKLR